MASLPDQFAQFVGLMVDRPEAVEVGEISGTDSATLELRVAQEDLGKVIGRQGRTARALRTVLAAREAKGEERYSVDILDD